jgi:hypothetical protein
MEPIFDYFLRTHRSKTFGYGDSQAQARGHRTDFSHAIVDFKPALQSLAGALPSGLVDADGRKS